MKNKYNLTLKNCVSPLWYLIALPFMGESCFGKHIPKARNNALSKTKADQESAQYQVKKKEAGTKGTEVEESKPSATVPEGTGEGAKEARQKAEAEEARQKAETEQLKREEEEETWQREERLRLLQELFQQWEDETRQREAAQQRKEEEEESEWAKEWAKEDKERRDEESSKRREAEEESKRKEEAEASYERNLWGEEWKKNKKIYEKVLGFNLFCNKEKAKKIYRSLILKCHSDKGGNQEKDKLINNAYTVFKNLNGY